MAMAATMGRPINSTSPHRTTAPKPRAAAASTATAARGASRPSRRPRIRLETVNASHTASQPTTDVALLHARGFQRSHDPSRRPSPSTTGRCRDTTSPSIRPPSATVTVPSAATTSSRAVPLMRTSPLKATSASFTVPSTTTGPSKMMTLSTVSPARTSARPVSTTMLSGSSSTLRTGRRRRRREGEQRKGHGDGNTDDEAHGPAPTRMIADPEAQKKRHVPSWTAPIATADPCLTVGNQPRCSGARPPSLRRTVPAPDSPGRSRPLH